MYIYTADPAILLKLKRAQHNRKLDSKKSYSIASQNSDLYSDVLAVLCAYEQTKLVSLTKVDRIPVGNTYLDSTLFKEEVYSCTFTESKS